MSYPIHETSNPLLLSHLKFTHASLNKKLTCLGRILGKNMARAFQAFVIACLMTIGTGKVEAQPSPQRTTIMDDGTTAHQDRVARRKRDATTSPRHIAIKDGATKPEAEEERMNMSLHVSDQTTGPRRSFPEGFFIIKNRKPENQEIRMTLFFSDAKGEKELEPGDYESLALVMGFRNPTRDRFQDSWFFQLPDDIVVGGSYVGSTFPGLGNIADNIVQFDQNTYRIEVNIESMSTKYIVIPLLRGNEIGHPAQLFKPKHGHTETIPTWPESNATK